MNTFEVPKMPPLPEYDAARDKNPFAWIVRTAPKVRAQREDEMSRIRIERRLAERGYYDPIK